MASEPNATAFEMAADGLAGSAKLDLDAAIVAYYDDIRMAVRKRGAGQNQATEIVHDLYLQLSRKPDHLRGKRSVRAFLIRAAINLRLDRMRRTAFEARLFEALESDDHPAAPASAAPPGLALESRLDRPKRLSFLQQAILDLPPQCRNVFIAHRIAGMDKDEIAGALRIRRGMVNRHLKKAMLHLLDRMEEFDAR